MAWIVLVAAGLLEVVWASLLPRTQGFSRLLPTLGFLVSLAASMVLLAQATRTLPIGTAYAIWVGIGSASGPSLSPQSPDPSRCQPCALRCSCCWSPPSSA